MAEATSKPHPPKDGLVRAARPGLEIRDAADGDKMPTLYGHLLRFNEPTKIDSIFEGTFIERIAPGAAKRTLKNNSGSIKILFNHGHDPHIGEKALAPPTLTEDDEGVAYEGEMFDTSYNRDLVPGLEAGQYGSSFKFRVVKETFDEEPEKSADNPDGLPERTIEELQLYEGGPVTFPAYEGAESGVRSRSLTDRMFIEGLKQDPSRASELDEVFVAWVGHNAERVRGILDAPAGDAGGNESAERKAIPYAKTGTVDSAWDGSATKADIPSDATESDLRGFFAWVDPDGDPTTKTAYKFIHHEVSDGKAGDANVPACQSGIGVLNGARTGTTIPDADRQGVYDHLAHHLKDAGEEPAPLRSRSELDEDSPEGTPQASEEASTEASDDARADALPGPEAAPHSADGTRATGSRPTPPWRQSQKKAPPWRGEKRS